MDCRKILVLGNENFLQLLKSTTQADFTLCKNRMDALAYLRVRKFDFVFVLYTGTKQDVLTFSKNCSLQTSVGVMVVCKQEIYDQVLYQCKDSGIIVLAYPIKKQLIYQAIQMLETVLMREKKYEKKINKLEQKYLELKMVDHCKLVLISNYHWSEDKAHRYIEKMAMDQSKTKYQVAKELLEEFS